MLKLFIGDYIYCTWLFEAVDSVKFLNLNQDLTALNKGESYFTIYSYKGLIWWPGENDVQVKLSIKNNLWVDFASIKRVAT